MMRQFFHGSTVRQEAEALEAAHLAQQRAETQRLKEEAAGIGVVRALFHDEMHGYLSV